MKKALAILITVCLLASLFVSCDNNARIDELVSVSFDASDTRSLEVSNESFIDFDDTGIKWQYTAVKDNSSDPTYNVGAASSWRDIPGETAGLITNVVEFSQGKWNFELRAIKKNVTTEVVVYYGRTEEPVLLTKQEGGRVFNIPINLTAQPSGQKGYIVLNNISVKHTSGSTELYDAPNKVIIDEGKESEIVFTLGTSTEIESVTTANGTALKTTGADGYQIDVGTYTVKVQKIGANNEVLAEDEKTIGVYAGLKTTVSNWIVEITQVGQFDVYGNAEELINSINTLENGGTITLDKHFILTDATIDIVSGKDITIDTAGYTIKSIFTEPSASAAINIKSGAKLTLKGHGSIEAYAEQPDVTWDAGFPGYANNAISNSGTLVIDGATVKVTTDKVGENGKRGASYCIDSYAGSKLTIKSGEIINDQNNAIRLFTSSATDSVDVTIDGGIIEGKRGIWVQLAGSSSSVAPKVNLVINGGEIKTNEPFDGNHFCNAIYSSSGGNSFSNTKVTINGGHFLGYVAFGGGYKGDRETVNITGGSFEAYYPDENGSPVLDTDCIYRYLENDAKEYIYYVTTAEELQSVANNQNSKVTVKLAKAGTYELPQMSDKEVSIIGTKDTVIDMMNKSVNYAKSISFEGVTVKFGTENYFGFQHTGKLTYRDCTITGKQFLYADEVEFNKCVFEQGEVDYNVWTYGAGKVLFKDCTFNCAGKSVLIYKERSNIGQTVEFKNCKFSATAPADGKAAIEIDSSLLYDNGKYTVIIDQATANSVSGFGTGSVSNSSVWNNKKGDKATVIVAGNTVLSAS